MTFSLRFGYFLTPDATDPHETARRARVCDATGYDLIHEIAPRVRENVDSPQT